MSINTFTNINRCTIKTLLSVFFTLVLLIETAPAGTTSTVFFYNPESSVDNFAALKSEFDDYLSNLGEFAFQPFSERATFETALTEKSQGIYLLSSWHYTQLNSKTPLEAKLVGVSKGELQQRKILTAKDISTISSLSGATIAGAGSDEYIKGQLQQMLGSEYSVIIPKIKLLSVPKDIDALMAVGYGVAGAAISSETSFNKLAMINPKQHAQLKKLADGEKNFLLIAAVTKVQKTDETPLLKVIEGMQDQEIGERKLKMLGLDGWKRIDALDASLSKQLR